MTDGEIDVLEVLDQSPEGAIAKRKVLAPGSSIVQRVSPDHCYQEVKETTPSVVDASCLRLDFDGEVDPCGQFTKPNGQAGCSANT